MGLGKPGLNRKFRNFIQTENIRASQITNTEMGDDSIDNDELSATLSKTLLFQYDFARETGAAGAIPLVTPAGLPQTLPDNAVITEVVIEGITDLTSGGAATVSLGYTGQAIAFLGVTALTHATWNVNNVTVGTATAAVGKTGGGVEVLATIADADLTAGKFQVWVTYFEGA